MQCVCSRTILPSIWKEGGKAVLGSKEGLGRGENVWHSEVSVYITSSTPVRVFPPTLVAPPRVILSVLT